ncbi:MAG: hypothetical protein LIO62_03635 [Clostridiales bacterium]|nr:hypothetical protein [Clostridiales bacterium]
MIIGIQDEILRLNAMGLLEVLLKDKTTKSNIIWATDAYSSLGSSYQRDKEIEVDMIVGENSGVIKNRARKALMPFLVSIFGKQEKPINRYLMEPYNITK